MKYHLNNTGMPEYGEDHKLTDNWDATAKYPQNEYIRLYFRVRADKFDCMRGMFEDNRKDGECFYNEVRNILESVGFKVYDETEVYRGKESLYIHPQNISGYLSKNNVREVCEALQKGRSFSIEWTDLYDTFYDLGTLEYKAYLRNQQEKIDTLLLENAVTKRSNLFVHKDDLIELIASRIVLCRIGFSENHDRCPDAERLITYRMNKLRNEGRMVEAECDKGLIRSANKKEIQKLSKTA